MSDYYKLGIAALDRANRNSNPEIVTSQATLAIANFMAHQEQERKADKSTDDYPHY